MPTRENATSSVSTSGDRATLAITIDGPYFPLAKFRKALDSFIDLLSEVDKETSESGNPTVEWAIASIEAGSIHITAVANPVSEETSKTRPRELISTITRGLEQLQAAPVIPSGFSEAALRYSKTFGEIINPSDFAEIRFGSNGWNTNIAPRLAGHVDEITKTTQKFYGSLEGTLVSISLAAKQKLGIRTSLEGRVIPCYFKDDLFDLAKEALGRRVYVFGLIRQRAHGPKINIQVDEMRILPAPDEMPTVDDILAILRQG
jgi:hypothetical protein